MDLNTEIHRAICRRGAFIGFYRQGGPNDDAVVPIVMSLIEAGYADHLMFSSDFSSGTALKRNNKDLGYAKTLTVFVPKLKKAGAGEEVLRQIMNDNPRAFWPSCRRSSAKRDGTCDASSPRGPHWHRRCDRERTRGPAPLFACLISW